MSNPTELPDRLEALRAALHRISETRFGWDGDCGVTAIADDALSADDEAARRAQPEGEALAGRLVSVDVSTSEEDGCNRIFAELTGETGSDGTTLLAFEKSRNFSAPGTPEAPADIDYSIQKGDTVYTKTWRLTSLEVVDVKWALRAIAVRLGPTGGVVVWSAAGLSKMPYHDSAAQLDGGQGEGS